jgi:hypothetical protein
MPSPGMPTGRFVLSSNNIPNDYPRPMLMSNPGRQISGSFVSPNNPYTDYAVDGYSKPSSRRPTGRFILNSDNLGANNGYLEQNHGQPTHGFFANSNNVNAASRHFNDIGRDQYNNIIYKNVLVRSSYFTF